MENKYSIQIANNEHFKYAEKICEMMTVAAKQRGTGIAKRSPDYIKQKIEEGKAVIALDSNDEPIGFCYIETWQHGKYVANSGLIVSENYRGKGLAKAIKKKAFELSRKKFPDAKMFGLTTSLAVMKINSDLGYKPVTFSELTQDDAFWKGCESCINYDILNRTERKHCLCTGMLLDPNKEIIEKHEFKGSSMLYGRWLNIKRLSLLKKFRKQKKK